MLECAHHPTALIDPGAQLAGDVQVGPFAVIEAGVRLGEGCRIGPHAVLQRGTELGAGCRVAAHAVLGGDPQDLRFDPNTPSGVRIGAGSVVREGVTVHRSTREGGLTEVGAEACLMACAHVAHDCVLGDRVILANNVLLAGHASIGADTFVGGGAAFHQHNRVGEGVMVSGLSRISREVPPYCLVAERDELIGLNLVGLRRRGTPPETIRVLKQLFQEVFCLSEAPPQAVAQARLGEGTSAAALPEEARRFLAFFAGVQRGLVQLRADRREALLARSQGVADA